MIDGTAKRWVIRRDGPIPGWPWSVRTPHGYMAGFFPARGEAQQAVNRWAAAKKTRRVQ